MSRKLSANLIYESDSASIVEREEDDDAQSIM
jgi:hypothetical protein